MPHAREVAMAVGTAIHRSMEEHDAANIAYKLLSRLGGATAIGPILSGMRRPVHVLQRGADVQEIVNMAAVAVVDAQERTQIAAAPAFASPQQTILSRL